MNKNDLIVKIPFLRDVIPERQYVNLAAANGTYMYNIIRKDGLQSFESEALGVTAALIECFEIREFADVGANIGVFSWAMKSIFGTTLSVTSYEPLPMLSKVLKDVYKQNSLDIEICCSAMSNVDGNAIFYVSASTDSSNSLNKDFRAAKDEIEVVTVKMDSSFDRIRPKVIKIDTETTEPAVLKGGEEYIAKERPFLIIEVLANRTEEPLTTFCNQQKYHAYKLDGQPLKRAEIIEGDKTYKYRDWLFVPAEIQISSVFSDRYLEWVDAFSSTM